MVEIVWNKNIEPHNKTEIEKYITPFLWIVPAWCHELRIALYDSDNHGGTSAIRTGINYEYRRASMDFYSCWLACSEYEKGLHVVHDLLHVPNSIYVDFAEECINRLCPSNQAEKFNGSMMEASRMYCESMTQDLAKAIYEKFRAQ